MDTKLQDADLKCNPGWYTIKQQFDEPSPIYAIGARVAYCRWDVGSEPNYKGGYIINKACCVGNK